MASNYLGSEWTSTLYFYPNIDDSPEKVFHIADIDLIRSLSDKAKPFFRKLHDGLSKIVGPDEQIKSMSIYECALSTWQRTQETFCHNFVVFKTESWYWSIEKKPKGIILQRSKHEDKVKNMCVNKERNQWEKICLSKQGEGHTCVMAMLRMLGTKHELSRVYNIVSDNCKHFAQLVFDFTTAARSTPTETSSQKAKRLKEYYYNQKYFF